MIIDVHTHAFNPKIAERAISGIEAHSGITPYTRGLVNQLTDRFDEWGVDMGVMLSIATKPSQQQVINDWAAQINRENSRIIAFGSVNPFAKDATDEIARIKSLGLRGVKLHPDYQHFMADDPIVDDIYDCLEESGLALMLHAGFDSFSPDLLHAPPERILNVIKRHPKLRLIVAHLGGNERWEDVYDVLAGVGEEVYFDTSFTSRCPDELMKKIIEKHGADRILLGSDCPWESTQRMIEKLLRLRLGDGETDKILGENAAHLFDL
jgi:hypothetical protein